MLVQDTSAEYKHFDFRAHEGSIDQRAKKYKAVDCGLVVALQKVVDIEFVPPIDVPTGAIVTDKKLRNRYWTVFNPDAFRMRKIPSRLLSNLRRRFRVS